MRRLLLIPLLILALVLFLALSAVLTRVLSLDGAERAAITGLLQAQAQGDASAMIAQIQGCAESQGCRARAAENASRLRQAGSVKILELGSSAGFSLGSSTGTSRVAWRAGSALPVVQCVRVRRAGNAISGFHIELLEMSRRIKTDADCPAHY